MEVSTRKLVCKEKSCKKEFDFLGRDQLFFMKQGWSDPVRCPACRAAKKAKKESQQPRDKEWGNCESCDNYQPLTEVGMCGPCTFGEADTLDGNW